MSDEVAQLKASIKILFEQDAKLLDHSKEAFEELRLRIVQLEKDKEDLLKKIKTVAKNAESEARRIRQFTNTPPSGYFGPL